MVMRMCVLSVCYIVLLCLAVRSMCIGSENELLFFPFSNVNGLLTKNVHSKE